MNRLTGLLYTNALFWGGLGAVYGAEAMDARSTAIESRQDSMALPSSHPKHQELKDKAEQQRAIFEDRRWRAASFFGASATFMVVGYVREKFLDN